MVVLADIMGHGVAAALYTMQLRLLIEDGRESLAEPGRFLSELNHRLHPLVRRDRFFASAVCFSINAADGGIRAASAGHPPALIFGRGGAARPVHPRGLALGLIADTTYPEVTDCLDRGDALLAYTDGATEIEGLDGEELGLAGLKRVCAACGVPDNGNMLTDVEESLLAASAQVRFRDDLTLLLVKRSAHGGG